MTILDPGYSEAAATVFTWLADKVLGGAKKALDWSWEHGPVDLLNLIIEVTGEQKKDKAAKVATARTLWVPAVNQHAAFGRWGFIEIADPWDAENTIRGDLHGKQVDGALPLLQ